MFCTFSRHFHDFYLHFFLFLGQMGRAGQKNKRIIKTYVFAMFSEILGSCPAHSFFYFFKKNQKNVKLTAAHQYWGAPQCIGSRLTLCTPFTSHFCILNFFVDQFYTVLQTHKQESYLALLDHEKCGLPAGKFLGSFNEAFMPHAEPYLPTVKFFCGLFGT